MSQPLDSPVGSLELTIQALVGLARDRGATPAQRELLGAIWADLQAADGDASGLHRRATALAAELLGVDSLLAPANAPYGGLWQELEATAPEPPTAPTERADDGGNDAVRALLASDPAPSWATLATHVPVGELTLAALGGVLEELARHLVAGPFLQTLALFPCLEADERARVTAGETSWALATGPLVLDLDTATSIAIVGGDGIFELVGAERELLETRDPSHPLGVVSGGDPGRRIAASTSLPLVRRRLLVLLAYEAIGLLDPVGDGARGARSLARRAAGLVDAGDPEAELAAAAAKAVATERAWEATTASGDAVRRERARFARAWEASPSRLHLELGDALLAEEDPWMG